VSEVLIRDAEKGDWDSGKLIDLVFAGMHGMPDMAWRRTPTEMTIADAAGQIVGLAMGRRIPDGLEIRDRSGIYELEALAEGTWFIQALAVSAAWTGRDVARLLLADASAKASASRSRGISAIAVRESMRAQTDTVSFWAERGFAAFAERNGHYSLGFPVTWILMIKGQLDG
jgi:GNAT superfamily N-acetyltransferase